MDLISRQKEYFTQARIKNWRGKVFVVLGSWLFILAKNAENFLNKFN
jgi:hypothetical protein